MSDRRQSKAPVPGSKAWPPIPVLLRAGERNGCGLVLNLCESSAFVATSLILRPKSRLHLVVAGSGSGQTMEVEGEVVWHHHRFFPIFKQLPAGYGIRFTEGDHNRRLIHSLLQGAARKSAQSVA